MSLGRAGVLRGGTWVDPLLEAFAQPPRAAPEWMAQHTQILKSDDHSRVGLIELRDELCYLKFYRQKSIIQQCLFWMGRGRGISAFDRAVELAGKGVDVPEPRACVLVPRGMLLLTEGLPQSRDLKALWLDDSPRDDPGKLLAAAGQTLATLHRAGYAHGDCKWSNLLWNDKGFYLVDLEAVDRASPGSRKQARDLARFTVNAEDLGVDKEQFSHFLNAYCDGTGIPREVVVDRLMPYLQQYRERHRRKYGKRGAPLL